MDDDDMNSSTAIIIIVPAVVLLLLVIAVVAVFIYILSRCRDHKEIDIEVNNNYDYINTKRYGNVMLYN